MAGKIIAEIWLDVRPYNGGAGTGPGGGDDDGSGTAIVGTGLNQGVIIDTIGGGITFMGAGSIKGGKTAYDVGQGFWLGADGTDPLYYKVAIGDPSGDTFNWDGTEINSKMNNLELRGYLRGPADFVIDPATHGDDTGEVTIAGNLEVAGGTIKGPAELIIDPATHGDDTGTVNIKGATLKVPNDFTIDPATHGDDTGSLIIAGASLKVPNNFAIDPATHGDDTGTLVVSGNVEVAGGTITGPATIVIDPAVVGANSGLVQILGDLQVDGLTTTINSSVMTVDDKNVVIGEGAQNAAAVNLGGFTLEGANATILYTSSDDKWNLNKGLNITGDLDVAGDVTATGALIGETLDIGGGDLTVNASGDLITAGNLTVAGVSSLNGNINLGDQAGDTVVFNARVGSDIIPTNSSYDLGGLVIPWDKLYVNSVFAGELDVGDGDFVVDEDGNLDANNGTFASLTIDGANPGVILKQVNAQGTPMSLVSHLTMNLNNVDSTAPTDATVLKYNTAQGQYESVDFKTTSLEDVSNTTASDNQILKYNLANTQYEPVNHNTRQLEDVSNTAPANDQILQYNSSTSQYEPENFVLDTLTDVTIADLADGDLLVYQSSTSDWRNKTKAGAGFHAIALSGSWADLENTPTTIAGYGITDVYTKTQVYTKTEVDGLLYTDGDVDTHLNRSTASTDEILSWNGSDYEWINYSEISGAIEELGDLSDVGLSSPNILQYNDVLTWQSLPGGSGGYWTDMQFTWSMLASKPTTVAGFNITDFDTRIDSHLNQGSAATDQILSWNGTDYAWVAGPSGTNLRDLNDVSQVGANNKDILRYNSTSSAWENDGFSIYSIGELGNVSNAAPAANNLLVWNGSIWAPGTVPTNAVSLALNDISDVSLGTLNTNDYLKWDGSAWVDAVIDWTHVANKPTILTTADLYTDADVDTHLNRSSAQTNQTLTWNGTDYSWSTPATGVSVLNDLADVATGSPSSGQVLKYNGTNWVSSSVAFADLSAKPTTIAGYGITDAFSGSWNDLTDKPGFAEDLGDLGDVTLSGVADGHMIKYSSANSRWENTLATLAALADTNITSPSNNHVLSYNSSNQKWESSSFSIGNLTNVNTGADSPSSSSSTTGASPAVLWYSSSSNEWNAAPLEIDDLYGVPDPAGASASVGDILAIKTLTHPQEYEWVSPNTSSANLTPGTTNTYDIGSSTKVWRDLHLGRNIELGNITLSNNSGVFEVDGNAIATQAYVGTHVSTEIANLVDSAPATLDTLNELAAALGDDPNFATTTATSLGNKLNTSDFNSTADGWLVGKTTDDLGEGSTNLYHTEERVQDVVAAQFVTNGTHTGISFTYSDATDGAIDATVSLSGFNSDNLSEGSTNLYYTDARSRAAISVGGDLSYNSTTGVVSFTERTDAEVRGLVSATGDLSYNSTTGAISFTERTDAEVRGLISTSTATASGGGALAYNSTTGVFTYTPPDLSNFSTYTTTDFNTDFATKTTSNLTEGTNLYYTDARVQTKLGAISGSIIPNANETYDLGSSTYKFRDLYLSGNTLTLGTLTISDSSGSLAVSSGGSPASFSSAGIDDNATSTAITIDSSGNVGINQNTPSAKLDVSGTIKLDGNFPTGTGNVALGDTALDASLTGNYNTAIGHAALTTNTSGANSVAIGGFALEDNTTGIRTVAVGYGALRRNTTANSNVAVGYAALNVNTTGGDNNALGRAALASNTTGGDNNAFGYNALNDNTTGTQNTAMGHASLDHSTTASYNTAFGAITLTDVTTGIGNTAVGRGAGANLVTDSYVTAIGYNALTTNTGHSASLNVAVGGYSQANATSFYNTSVGYRALEDATSHSNTAVGRQSLAESTSGTENVALGNMAMPVSTSASYSTAVGSQALYGATSGSYNTAVGRSAAISLTTGSNNVSIGNNAHNSLTTGQHTTAIGVNAGYNGTSASYNVFVGNYAGRLTTSGSNVSMGYATLYNNTSGSLLTAVGQGAMYYNTTGATNTAFGSAALQTNTTGSYNTAVGGSALIANTTASYGVAVGYQTLDANTTGARNCAVGYVAMSTNTTGNYNTALGSYALFYQTTPNFNVGVGYQSGYNTTTGFDNTYLGTYAGYTGTAAARNVYIGYTAGYYGTGSNNVALGYQAGNGITSGSNLTVIGYDADPSSGTATNEVTLGNSSVSTLRCNASLTGLSDERDKKNIETLGSASNFIKALRPVSFDWNQRDGGRVGDSDHGFIAQELKTAQEKTNWHVPNLVYESNPDKLEASYATLLPSVVSALQEALVEIETLKAELSALKGD